MFSMRVARFLLFLSVLVACSGCSSKPNTGSGSGQATVTFGVSPFQDTLVPIVGQEKGWYQQEGLKVNFKSVDWPLIPEALASGSVDVVISNMSAVIAVHNRAPNIIYLYATNPFDNGSALMIRPNGKLKTLQQIEAQVHDHGLAVQKTAAQLKGKTVITTAATDMEQSVAAAARKGGLNFSRDVKIINLNPDEGLAAFLGGEGDAYMGGIPQRTRAEKEGMVEMLTGTDLGPPPINGFVTTSQYYRAHSAELLKLLHVWFRIVSYIDSNPDDGGGIIVRELNAKSGAQFTLDDFKRFWNHYESYPSSPNQVQQLILSASGKDYWKATWDDCNTYFYTVTHSIPQPVDPNGVFLMPEFQEKYIAEYGSQ
jgi:NitT/TauT family transport system substrate-binding protein